MRFTFFGLVAVVLLSGQLSGCARPNQYDSLKVLALEDVRPVVQRAAAGDSPRIGIAFGGGGVRGFVHLGVLRALEEAGIAAHVVTGTSAGALAATLHASGLRFTEIDTLVRAIDRFQLLDIVFSMEGAINGQAYAAWIRAATRHRPMRDFPLPLGITVTDLGTGTLRLIVDGDPGEAVHASAAVPGTVIPVQSNGRTLVDGGVLSVVPVRSARALGADLVIAIDIFCGEPPALRGHALDTMLRTFRLQSCLLSQAEIAEADILIRPDYEPSSPVSFAERDQAIESGYRAMQQELPAIRTKLAGWQMPAPRP